MSNEDYLIKYLEEKFENMDKRLNDIHKQTKRTNGRVTKLENWRAWSTGIYIGVSTVASVVVAVGIKMISN